MKTFMTYLICIVSWGICFLTGFGNLSAQINLEPNVYKGSTIVEQVYSPGLEGNLQGNPSTQPVKIYLPPGYDNFPNNHYPVVYLLHGHPQDYNSFYQNSDLLNILNEAISQKIMVPMIIITPNGSTEYDGSFYTNSYVTGNWEDFIVQDVTRYIEDRYRILDQRDSRGLSGFSGGGYGTVKIGMKHPSMFRSIGIIDAGGVLHLELCVIQDDMKVSKNNLVAAAQRDQFDPNDDVGVRICFAAAAAFSPDSTAVPKLVRFPFTTEGERIDSIWQKWLMHDPYTMLQTHTDSLLLLDSIRFWVAREGVPVVNEAFHAALLDRGIDHGYSFYPGGHDPKPVFDSLFMFFTETLVGTVPTIHLRSNYYLEKTDDLIAKSTMDGKICIVPEMVDPTTDSIFECKVTSIEVMAEEESEIELAELEYGRYQVYAVTKDSAVSNVPGEFCLVPDKSPPEINLKSDTVMKGDSIRITSDRDVTLCLIVPSAGMDTFHTVYEITHTPRLFKSAEAPSDTETGIGTEDLGIRSYWIYAYDEYGIVGGPVSVVIIRDTSTTGIKEKLLLDIKVFPNPVNNMITIQAKPQGPFEIEITALNGQQVFPGRMEGVTSQIDLSSFQKGVYVITIRSKEFVTTRKIIKLQP